MVLVVLCLSQMVAAHFRFPLGVYALTTARSTSTPQISRRLHRGIEFEAVSIASSSPFVILQAESLTATWKLASSNPNMPSQEAGSGPAPGTSSGAGDRQVQDAQGGAGPTSPPRTEQELAQVRTRKSKSSPSKSSAVNARLALGYFPQPRVPISPRLAGWTPWAIQTPVRGASFDFPQDPELYCIPACSSTSSVVVPRNGSQKPSLNCSLARRPVAPVPALYYVLCHVQRSTPC